MKQALDFAINRHGDTWTDLSGNSVRGYYDSKEDKLCLKLETPIEEASILKRECSQQYFLVTNVANNAQWLEVSLLLCKKTARVDRPVDSGLNSFGRFEAETLQLVYECVPLSLTSSRRQKTEKSRDQEHGYTVYELQTASTFDIRLNDQLTLGTGGPLTVRTVDELDGFLRITASEA